MENIKSTKSIKKLPLIVMILMAVVSFTNLFGVKIAGVSVILGVVFFFIVGAQEKQPTEGSGLDIKSLRTDLKNKRIWFWIILPLVMDIVSISIGKLFLPGYIEHVIGRAGNFVSFKVFIITIIQLAVLALGEEIAWRAFFQNQLNKVLSIIPVLLISSVLFGIGHFNQGNANIVFFDVFFVFINSILYGIIFHKTKNAWVSAISHFVANLFSIIVLVFI